MVEKTNHFGTHVNPTWQKKNRLPFGWSIPKGIQSSLVVTGILGRDFSCKETSIILKPKPWGPRALGGWNTISSRLWRASGVQAQKLIWNLKVCFYKTHVWVPAVSFRGGTSPLHYMFRAENRPFFIPTGPMYGIYTHFWLIFNTKCR